MHDLNKTSGLMLFVIFLCACTHKKNSTSFDVAKNDADSSRKADSLRVVIQKKSFKPYKLNKYYTAIDTGEFSAGTFGGTYAIIEREGKIADTIDLGYGLNQISDNQYLYFTLKKDKNNTKNEHAWPGVLQTSSDKYIAVLKNKKVVLKEILQGFNNHKSAPNVINGNIYFWQYDKINGNFKVSAAKYNVKTGSTTSHYLFSNDLESIEHFSSPVEENNAIVFYWESKTWRFSPDFKLIK